MRNLELVTSQYGRTPPNKHGGVGRQQQHDQGCPLILSERDWKWIYCRHYTLNIQTHIPSFRILSPGFRVDKLPVLSSSHDQDIVCSHGCHFYPSSSKNYEHTISVPTPHPALEWFAASQSFSCYLTPVAWNNLPASILMLDKASTMKNHCADHPMRHDFLATWPDAFSE